MYTDRETILQMYNNASCVNAEKADLFALCYGLWHGYATS